MGIKGKRVKRLESNQVVTQYGNSRSLAEGKWVFRRRPHPTAPEPVVSVTLGRLQPLEAALCVGRMPRGGDKARWTTVGELRSAGFEVAHDPTEGNALHAIVKHDAEWDDAVGTRFDECFTEAPEEGSPDG